MIGLYLKVLKLAPSVLTLLFPYMLQCRSNMISGAIKCLEMTANVIEKIKGLGCSFVFPVLLFLTAALADEYCCTVHN